MIEATMRNGKRVFAHAFKSWLIEQASQPGASVAGLALRHGINANQLRRWMKLASGRAQGQERLLPVHIARPAAMVGLAPAAPGHAASMIEVQIGSALIRLHGAVDAQRLRAVLAALGA